MSRSIALPPEMAMMEHGYPCSARKGMDSVSSSVGEPDGCTVVCGRPWPEFSGGSEEGDGVSRRGDVDACGSVRD
jgi:hypothetical protein